MKRNQKKSSAFQIQENTLIFVLANTTPRERRAIFRVLNFHTTVPLEKVIHM